ncbi:MAG TPA: enoyl-CoA hydratase/isomerase family protein [Bryobacteraceae bacterium]|nr:enoyl-CoA hydratase/isomerase family protein [Bryobacteraceae bacterium]
MSESLLVSREERVLRITLNRPEKKNALNAELCRGVLSAVEEADADPGIGCVLLDSRGDVFCAGMDLDETTTPEGQAIADIHGRLFTIGRWLRKPLVAAISGPALGGGVGLVANAHIAVAVQGCTFALTEVRIGMWPFAIWPAIAQALGTRRALSLALTGRVFSVAEAVQWGLVHEVAPAFELDDRAFATAVHLAGLSAATLRSGLEFVRAVEGLEGEAAVALALARRAEVFRSPDFLEGVAALREKRRPRWTDG